MRRKLSNYLALLLLLLAVSAASPGQAPVGTGPQEISEADGRPVIFKHLPKPDAIEGDPLFLNSNSQIVQLLGERPLLSEVELGRGTEAAFAVYPAGKLLLVENSSPQASIAMDESVLLRLASQPELSPTAYRRIGNYNAFVFDGPDAAAAGELLNEIRYEKTVQWLGQDPYILKKLERYMVMTTRDIFISTIQIIVFGILGSILAGIVAGYFYFRFRDRRRERTAAFSDAGGLTRLNIDELTSEVSGGSGTLTA